MRVHLRGLHIARMPGVILFFQTALESGVEPQQAALAAEQLDEIGDKFSPSSAATSRLTAIFFSLVGWAIVITIVLLVVVSLIYRRWRHQRQSYDIDAASQQPSDAGDADAISVTDSVTAISVEDDNDDDRFDGVQTRMQEQGGDNV
jgi:uncharacterized membrane protein